MFACWCSGRRVRGALVSITLYNRIEADPPWPLTGGGGKGVQEHYPVIKTKTQIYDEMAYARFSDNTPVWRPDPAQCHLWLWVVNNYLTWGIDIMGWLGFRYVTNFVWTKQHQGIGQYAFSSHELCLFGTMGATRYKEANIRTDFGGPIDHERYPTGHEKAGRRIHSRKPQAILDQIDKAYPTDRALEMFARTNRPGVTSWGNETNAMQMGQISLL